MSRGSSSLRIGAIGQARQRIVRRQVLQRQLVFLRATLGLAPMRHVLEDHGVDAAGARFQVGDREFHVAPFVVAAQDLRRTALGRFITLAAGRQ